MGRNAPSKAKKAPLDTLLSRLSVQTQKNEVREAVATSKLILEQTPNDTQTISTFITICLDNDLYSELYQYFDTNASQKKNYIMEYGYVLYKLDKHDELVDLIGDKQSRGFLHLLAQSHYKQGNFSQARKIYNDVLLKTPKQVELEEYDLVVNERAILAQLKLTDPFDESVSVESNIPEGYDQIFNDALILIAQKQYPEALDLLTRAKVMCQTAKDLTPESLASELSPILFQAAYVNILLNKNDTAAKILDTIDYENLKDSALLYLIGNVRLLLDNLEGDDAKYSNPHKALAFLDEAGNYNSIRNTFVPLQQQILSDNRFLLELAAGKSPKNLLKAQSKRQFPVSKSTEGYSFYTEVQDLSQNNQLKALKKVFSQKKDNVALAFTIAQLHANLSEYSLAASAVVDYIKEVEKKFPEQAYAPGVVSALSSLTSLSGKRTEQFVEVLENAVTYWSKNSSTGNETATRYLFADAAIALSGTGKESQVKAKLNELYKETPEDVVVVSGLLGLGDAQVTEKYAAEEKNLLPVSDIVGQIDVDALSIAGLEPLLKKKRAFQAEAGTTKEKPVKSRTNKKAKLSKNYDPELQPDPERWIPLRDRSTYKPPKAKGNKKKVLASTQGGAVDESLSVTSGAHSNTPAPAVAKPKTKNIKKNKKKGRK